MKRKLTALLLVLLCVLIAALSGCGDSTQSSESKPTSEAVSEIMQGQENAKQLEDAFLSALSDDAASFIKSHACIESNGKYSANVRTYAAGEYYFPEIIETGVKAFFDKANELCLDVSDFTLLWYSENENHDTTNMISWRTSNGASGTFIYNSQSEQKEILKMGYTANDIRKFIGENPFSDSADSTTTDAAVLDAAKEYQGEWYEDGYDYWRLYFNDGEMLDVLFDDYEQGKANQTWLFELGLDESQNLILKNAYGQNCGYISINENGELTITDPDGSKVKTYLKASDKTFDEIISK